MEQDKINILNDIGTDRKTGLVNDEVRERNLLHANRSLRGYFALAAWPQALKRGLVQDFAFGGANKQGIGFNLAQVLVADEDRTYLQFTLSGFEEVDDEEVQTFSRGLPPRLTHLNVSFEDCPNLSDDGFIELATKLQELPLQKLE